MESKSALSAMHTSAPSASSDDAPRLQRKLVRGMPSSSSTTPVPTHQMASAINGGSR